MITVLTDRYGKISVVARGVRRITSRRAGNVELLNRVKLHLFKAKNYTLTEAEAIEVFPKLKENLGLTTSAFHVIEIIDRLTPEGQVNRNLYDLTVSVLQLLEKNPRQIFLRAFEVKVLSLLGFSTFERSETEGAKLIHLEGVPEDIQGMLAKLEYMSWEEIGKLEISQAQALALEAIMRYYIEKTLEGSLRSIGVLKKLRT